MKKFLIVVDMQKDFVDGALGTPEAQKIVDKVAEKILNFDGYIIATMDTHKEDYMETREGKFLPVKHCINESEGWKIDEKVMDALKKRGCSILTKPTFGSIALIEKLKKDASSDEQLDIELVGLCTDICVVSNALLLKANFPEAEIAVDASCCAGVTPEKHQAALETMRSCQIVIK